MKNFNEWLDDFLKSRNFLLVLSLVFSLLLFFNVHQNFNFLVLENTVDYTLNDIKLDVTIDSETQILEGNPTTIGFRITGKKAEIEKFKNEHDIKAKIEVKDRFGENLSIPITYSSEKSSNVVITPLLKDITVNIYKKMTVEKEFQITLEGITAGYQMKGTPVILDENKTVMKTLKIAGSEKQVNKIAVVEFKLNVQGEEGEKSEKITPIARDSLGNKVQIDLSQYTIQYHIEKIVQTEEQQ